MRVPGNWKECLSFLILFLVAGLASAPGQTSQPPAKSVQSSNAPATAAPSPEASKYDLLTGMSVGTVSASVPDQTSL
jgi:hypothetical protein